MSTKRTTWRCVISAEQELRMIWRSSRRFRIEEPMGLVQFKWEKFQEVRVWFASNSVFFKFCEMISLNLTIEPLFAPMQKKSRKDRSYILIFFIMRLQTFEFLIKSGIYQRAFSRNVRDTNIDFESLLKFDSAHFGI
jgi:hypothetical protein